MPMAFVFRIPEDAHYFWAVPDSGHPSSMTIGRDPPCEVPVPAHFDTVSRRHARLDSTGDRHYIETWGKNLTWLNGSIVPRSCRIEFPCELRLGNLVLTVGREEIEDSVLETMVPPASTTAQWDGAGAPTETIRDIDWRAAVDAIGLTAHWASALFDITELTAQSTHAEQLRLALQQMLTFYLRADRVRLTFDVFPSTDESDLKEVTSEKSILRRLLALSSKNPMIFEVMKNGEVIVWGIYQSHSGAPRIAAGSATFSAGVPRNIAGDEMRWLALITLQAALPATLRLRELDAYKAAQPETAPVTLAPETLAKAKELNIRGTSKAFRECLYDAEIAATRYFSFNMGDDSLKVVLLQGEIGVGKSVLAKLIHDLSARSARPMISMNAANIVTTLAESELFGIGKNVAGEPERDGLFGHANNSTLFLDEIGNLHLSTQEKLNVVLTTGTYQRVGETGVPRRTNANLIVAANQDLAAMARDGRLRADLFARIRSLVIHVPPLRERKEEIPVFIKEELRRIRENNPGCELQGVASGLMDAFLAYPWPYNFRELREMIYGAAVFAPVGTETINWAHLRPYHRQSLLADNRVVLHSECDASLSWKDREDSLKREYIAQLLGACGGVFEDMVERAGVAPDTVRKMEKLLKDYLAVASEDEVTRLRSICGDGWKRVGPTKKRG